MWAELKIQEDSLVMAHRWLSFPQQLCSILPGVSCDPPTTASRNHTHSTFPKLLWELLWVETPGTVESKIFTGTTKIPCSRATLTAKWAAEVKTRCCSVIYFQHVHAQGEKLCWCHHALLQQAEQGATRLWIVPRQLPWLGRRTGSPALHIRLWWLCSLWGSLISFTISILSKVEILLLIREISQNLMFYASVSKHLGTLTFLHTAVLLIYFVKPRLEILSHASRDCHEILIITCVEKGKNLV